MFRDTWFWSELRVRRGEVPRKRRREREADIVSEVGLVGGGMWEVRCGVDRVW